MANKKKLPNEIILSELRELLSFSNIYEISIQFWPDNISVYIAKDGVDLVDFCGMDFKDTVTLSTDYIKRITGIENKNRLSGVTKCALCSGRGYYNITDDTGTKMVTCKCK